VDSVVCLFFFSSRRRHTRFSRDWSSDVCSSDLSQFHLAGLEPQIRHQVTHWLTIMALVAHGMGVSLVPKALTGARFRQEVFLPRSEERRVGKEGRARGWPDH